MLDGDKADAEDEVSCSKRTRRACIRPKAEISEDVTFSLSANPSVRSDRARVVAYGVFVLVLVVVLVVVLVGGGRMLFVTSEAERVIEVGSSFRIKTVRSNKYESWGTG